MYSLQLRLLGAAQLSTITVWITYRVVTFRVNPDVGKAFFGTYMYLIAVKAVTLGPSIGKNVVTNREMPRPRTCHNTQL